jgi:hypothetical protein
MDPPEDLFDAPLDSPLDDEFLHLGSGRVELALAQEESSDVH